MFTTKISSSISKILTRRILYQYVGRKHQQIVRYDEKTCREFNLILKKNDDSQTQSIGDNKLINRLFLGCLFSRIIGSNFPLSIYLSQQIKYFVDVPVNQSVIGQVQVVKDLGRNRYEILTTCKTQEGITVMQGKAIILQE